MNDLDAAIYFVKTQRLKTLETQKIHPPLAGVFLCCKCRFLEDGDGRYDADKDD